MTDDEPDFGITKEELNRRIPRLISLIEDIKRGVPNVLVLTPETRAEAMLLTDGMGSKVEVVATCGVCDTEGMAGAKSCRIPGANKVCLVCMKIVGHYAKRPVEIGGAKQFDDLVKQQETQPTMSISQVEVDRRMPALQEIFGDAELFKTVLVLMRTEDRILLKANGWEPSILHTLTTCNACGAQCWIGPEQAKQHLLARVCVVCYGIWTETTGQPHGPTISLNPLEAEIPRRTS